MEQHTLLGRTETESLWFERRSFLSAAATWTAMGGYSAAQAQERSNIVELVGDTLINGNRLSPGQIIQTGDTINTGPGASLVFVIGNAAFQVRQNSRFLVERGDTINVVSVLRLLTGAVASVWGKGNRRQIITPTLTAGIRGTGVYTEVFEAQDYRSYFCNCYGVVDMNASNEKTLSEADYHQAFWAEAQPSANGKLLNSAPALNHTDAELENLARLINQQTNWQITGKKGTKDGMGRVNNRPGQKHPADSAY